MMKLDKILVALCGVLTFTLCGCDASDLVSQPGSDGALAVRLAARGMSEGDATDAESQVNALVACRFEDGILSEVFESLLPDVDGVCHLRPSQMGGRVFFLANATDAVDVGALQPGVTTLEHFRQLEATVGDMTGQGILMTGMLTLSPDLPLQVSLALERSVARIDLDASFEGVEVKRVVIKGISETGYVNAQDTGGSPSDLEFADWSKTFEDDAPFKNRKSTLCYVAEQDGRSHDVEIEVDIDGAWHRLKTKLPAVRRNTVYTLKVYGKGADVRAEVLSEGWESGLSSESALQSGGWIDREASVLPEGGRLSEAGDTVYVPAHRNQMQLVLKTGADVDVRVQGRAYGVVVDLAPVGRTARFAVDVSCLSRLPGSIQEYIYLDLYERQVQVGRVVLSFRPSPVRVEGFVRFDTDSICDFARYVDGRLATFTLEDGKVMRLEFDAVEEPWLRLDEGPQANSYYLEGGWKPNDPKADGRVQTGKLVVSDADGRNTEVYVVKRQNWGLPVVNINGVWWCKYNLRGHVKDFAAQILVKDDPAAQAGVSVADYLKTCSDDDFLAALGDQYQGGNPEGLKLAYDGANFYYEGYQDHVNAAYDFGALEAASMAPDGYEVPDYDDFRFFSWGNDCALGYGSHSFNNQLGQHLSYTITERTVTFKGGNYGPINIYDFDYEGNHWVMSGLGHQWNASAGSLSKMMVLMATSGRSGKTWMLEGYPANSPQGRATWIKYADHNQHKTRTIRCVKTPVNYIYR